MDKIELEKIRKKYKPVKNLKDLQMEKLSKSATDKFIESIYRITRPHYYKDKQRTIKD